MYFQPITTMIRDSEFYEAGKAWDPKRAFDQVSSTNAARIALSSSPEIL
jgi:hypothetical protein